MDILRLVARNVVKLLLLLLAVSFVVFFLVSVSPVDPLQANYGAVTLLNMDPAKRAELSEFWGKDRPLAERYLTWLTGLVHGDLGMSLRFNQPVATVIAAKFANSALLLAVAWLISGVAGFALGVLAGSRRGKPVDKVIMAVCYLFAATPLFWFAMLLLMVFSVGLGLFPTGFSAPLGKGADEVTLGETLHHMILPAITLSIVGVANITLHTREKLLDVLESDFVRYAAARGESRRQILKRHALRNIALPALTLQFASLAEIFGGSILVEQVFSFPGLGQATVMAGLGSDTALLAGIAVITAGIVFVGNTIANILYGLIDPRIRARSLAASATGEAAPTPEGADV